SLFSGSGLVLGQLSTSLGTRLVVNGTLRATNQAGFGTLDVIRGLAVFKGGLMELDRLLLRTPESSFEFHGGNLMTRGGSISNGQSFLVGQSGGAIWEIK